MRYSLVTLCGSYNLSKHWVWPCFESWKNATNVDIDSYYLIPDAYLEEKDQKDLEDFGFHVFNSQESKEKIENTLNKYPSLKKLREDDLTWRKILDTCILLPDKGKIVLIDSDVLVASPCVLPEGDFDICYMREDIPAYRANWKIVWNEKMVPAFNAGLVIFDPATIDFSYLDFLSKQYFLQCKDYWWSEQSAWACLAGKMDKRMLFDGRQVRVLSGFKKRTVEEVINNKYNIFVNNDKIQSFEEFKPFVDGSTIIHFAGLGKHWFTESEQFLKESKKISEPVKIMANEEATLSLREKLIIGLRLFLKELK
ncbi:hypothetical protein [Desertivirga arenae]|uniref:hypothetical protein n=1 Tax=Desertivirga arenae TaxID=2810309 RepID=UPI001A975367|nr:hypothetical protein [Pedobacter sp. SYSU D00823]